MESPMDLYTALQELLNKINKGVTDARYSQDEREMLKIVLENQSHLGEAILILGGLMKAILADEITVQILPGSDNAKH